MLGVVAVALLAAPAGACKRIQSPRWIGVIEGEVDWIGEVAPGVRGHTIERFWVDHLGKRHRCGRNPMVPEGVERVPGFVRHGHVIWVEPVVHADGRIDYLEHETPEFPYVRWRS